MDEWDGVIQGLCAGDEAAMTAFVDRYRPALERIAQGAIAPGLQRRFGADSVAQSVCRTFLRRMRDEPYVVQDADALWRLLCAIALTKVREKARFHGRQRRGAAREVPLDEAAQVADDRAPPPDDAVAFREALEQALEDIDEEERRILELRLEGRRQAEIATTLECSERTVRRLLNNLEAKLRRRLYGAR